MDRIFLNTIFLFFKILYFLFMIFFFVKYHMSQQWFFTTMLFFIYIKKSPVLFSILERKNKKKNLRPFHFSWLEIL